MEAWRFVSRGIGFLGKRKEWETRIPNLESWMLYVRNAESDQRLRAFVNGSSGWWSGNRGLGIKELRSKMKDLNGKNVILFVWMRRIKRLSERRERVWSYYIMPFGSSWFHQSKCCETDLIVWVRHGWVVEEVTAFNSINHDFQLGWLNS